MTEVGEPIKRPMWAVILRGAGILVIVAANIVRIGRVLYVGVDITGLLLVGILLTVSVQNLTLPSRRGRNGSSRRRSQVHRPDQKRGDDVAREEAAGLMSTNPGNTVKNGPYILMGVLYVLGMSCFVFGAFRIGPIGPFADQFGQAGLALLLSGMLLKWRLLRRLRKK